jgi:S1-C subfamily serine protease
MGNGDSAASTSPDRGSPVVECVPWAVGGPRLPAGLWLGLVIGAGAALLSLAVVAASLPWLTRKAASSTAAEPVPEGVAQRQDPVADASPAPPASAAQGMTAAPAAPRLTPAQLASSTPSNDLKYAWKVGAVYECTFTATAFLGGSRASFRGKVGYRPSDAEPANYASSQQSGEGSGTAFVVHPAGVLVTCAHVVRGATDVQVHFGDTSYSAKVVAFDSARDLAVLKVDATGLPCLPLGDSDRVELGQDVRALGFPLSNVLGETLKITRGTIAGLINRNRGKLFQIDASINPGNSGGPLLDVRGRVVGVANAMLTGATIDRVGFAIPVAEALALMQERGLPLAPRGEPVACDGPELARRAGPSVALVKVQIGRGGVGATPCRVIDFTARYMVDPLGGSGVFPGFAGPSLKVDNGKMVVDSLGHVESCQGRLPLPLLVEPLAKIAVEELPDDGRDRWQSTRTVVLMKTDDAAGRYRHPGLDFRPGRRPYGLPPPRSSPRDGPPVVGALPAVEEIRYSRGPASGDGTVAIEKEYRLTAAHGKNDLPALQVTGSARLTWDKALGMPRRSEFTGTSVVSDKYTTARMSIRLTYNCQQKDAAPAEAAAVGDGFSPRSLSMAQPDRDPAGKLGPSPADVDAAPAKKTGRRERRAVAGLDRFNPEE